MDLSYNAEYEAFRQTVISFLKAHWPVPESAGDGAAEWPRAKKESWFRSRAIEAGFLYRGVPKEFGGAEQAPDILKATIIRDEFAKRRAPMEAPGIGNMMLVPTLLECGTQAQKERFVAKTLTASTSLGLASNSSLASSNSSSASSLGSGMG